MLRDGREPACGPRTLTWRAVLPLGHREHGGPAEVAALGALGGLEMLEAVAPCNAGRTALKALDDEGVHLVPIGGPERREAPRSGD